MNLSPDLIEVARALGAEVLPWPFGRLDATEVLIRGEPFEQRAQIAALFVELRWPDRFFRAPGDETAAIRLRFVEQPFVAAGRAYATFALDVVSGRAWSVAFDDAELLVHARDEGGDPSSTGQMLVAWLGALVPTDAPPADRTTWARDLTEALRRDDEAGARAVLEAVGPRARHPLLGTTPLHHVAIAGSLALFDELVAAGAEVDAATTQDGDPPFVYAAWGAQPAILERCIALHGVPPERTLARALEHALTFDKVVPVAAPRDPAAVVARLLACGADPARALEDGGGETLATKLLGRAVHAPRLDPVVGVFLAHGADPDAHRAGLARPLLAAIASGRHDLAERLHAAGAAVIRDDDRTTVLHAAVDAGASEDAIAPWLARGCDVDAVDASGRTALAHAAGAGRLAQVRALTALGARLDRADPEGRNARTLAALAGAGEVVAFLDGAGAAEQPEHAAAIAAANADRRARAEAAADHRTGRVVDGPFAGQTGHATVLADGQVRAVVSLFGRETTIVLLAASFVFDGPAERTD